MAFNVIPPGTSAGDSIDGTDAYGDLITGLGGADILHGLDGNDRLEGGAAGDSLYGDYGGDELYGAAGVDHLFGSFGEDTLYGGAAVDHLIGGNGNDYLVGGAGADDMDGGEDGDTYFIRAGDGTVADNIHDSGALGTDVLDVTALGSGSVRLADEFSRAITGLEQISGDGTTDLTGGTTHGVNWDFSSMGFSGIDQIRGSTLADTIRGTGNPDEIFGLGGADTLYGDYGSDSLSGGAGADHLFGFFGNDELSGGGAVDELSGGAGNDFLTGGAGADNLDGGYGDDTYIIGAADGTIGDEIQDVEGFDTLDITAVASGTVRLANQFSYENTSIDMIQGNGADLIGSTAALAWDFRGITLDGIDQIRGSTKADVILGSHAGDEILGLAGADNLDGDYGDDSLNGGAAGDFLDGGYGNDLLRGAEGADVLKGDFGNDRLFGDAGNDILIFDSHDLTRVDGGGGQDTMMASEMDQYIDLVGFAGTTFRGIEIVDLESDDFDAPTDNVTLHLDKTSVLAMSNTTDTLRVDGEGSDTVSFDGFWRLQAAPVTIGAFVYDVYKNGTAVVQVQQGVGVEIHGTSAANSLKSGAGNDALYGDNGDDLVFGGGGDDWLSGSYGNDVLHGGDGDDVLIAGPGDDALYGGEGSDWADISQTLGDGPLGGYANLAGGDDYGLVGGTGLDEDVLYGIENLAGSSRGDTLIGDDGANIIRGGDGNDTMVGGDGSDTLDFSDAVGGEAYGVHVNLTLHESIGFGTGHDTFTGFENVIGSDYEDLIVGDNNDNVIEGGTGQDVLYGGGGIDTLDYSHSQQLVFGHVDDGIFGGDGSDDVFGFENIRGSDFGDRLYGDEQSNALYGGDGNDFLVGEEGADVIYGEAERDILYGGDDADALYGGAEYDQLFGDDGADYLSGGAFGDDLHGGFGNDLLFGGAKDDWFFFDTVLGSSNIDTIVDFRHGQDDRITLSEDIFTSLFAASGGEISDNFVHVGPISAGDEIDDFLIYNTTTGALYYDATPENGDGDKIQFAVLLNNGAAATGVSAEDFQFIPDF